MTAGILLLGFGLQAPDHPLASELVFRRTTAVLGGLAIPFIASLVFMAKSRFGYGLLFALIMFPFMFGALMVLDI